MASPGSTVLPLLQTVQISTPSTIVPDAVTMNTGATVTLNRAASEATFNAANSALGASNVVLTQKPGLVYVGTSGANTIHIDGLYAASDLNWTDFGSWNVFPTNGDQAANRYHSEFVTGFQTPGSNVPTTGSATYSGRTLGQFFHGGSGGSDVLAGAANLTADFANRTIMGSLTDMSVGDPWFTGSSPWNSVSLSASFASGQSAFTGTAAVTSAPNHDWALKAGATGTVAGSFFGPNAEEVGAVWTLFDGTSSAIGSLGARRQ